MRELILRARAIAAEFDEICGPGAARRDTIRMAVVMTGFALLMLLTAIVVEG